MAAATTAGVKIPGSGSSCCCAAVVITATALATAVVPVKKLPFLWAPELYGGLSYFAEKKSEYRESSF
jgi:hypothetical protein